MPRRFFVAMAAALAGALGLHWAVVYAQLGVPTRNTVWAYEINQKKLQRAASIHRPKLLLAGGSATLFGIQAELIEERLNYPTVNMGTHAGLGLVYMLHLLKQAARPGDTVVLAFEYSTYTFGVVRRDPAFVDYLLARDPDYFRSLPLAARFEIAMMATLPRLSKGIKNRFKPEGPLRPTSVYHPSKLNIHGDQLGNEATDRPPKANRYGRDSTLLSVKALPAFANIKAFVSWARTNDVRVIATYPNLLDHPAYETELAEQTLQRIREAYARLQVPMIGSFEESLMPPSAFLDTHYHPTRQGARQRTERLIPHLAEVLRLGAQPAPGP